MTSDKAITQSDFLLVEIIYWSHNVDFLIKVYDWILEDKSRHKTSKCSCMIRAKCPAVEDLIYIPRKVWYKVAKLQRNKKSEEATSPTPK